jgi:phenylalanyl-tRNA synthetase beta chain
MTLSYQWLMDHLPLQLGHGTLSEILNSIGLEVEDYEMYEEVPGSLEGLIIGKVVETEKHPKADRLTLTRVDVGDGKDLRIVCGAPNVSAGQKVVVAPVGSTIRTTDGRTLTMSVAKIRGVESWGMICAEDEIGLGTSHDGILVLPDDATVGMAAAAYFKPYTDHVISIGLTPNRSDAMSHQGVARDVCAWLTHHKGLRVQPVDVWDGSLPAAISGRSIAARVEDPAACPRYAGIGIEGLRVGESPEWIRRRLKAVGIRPINNVVDVTNYVMMEYGQPLHAFDADRIGGGSILVRKLPEGTPFKTLDGKERVLDAEDLMICDGTGRPLCMAGVFGGLDSGVTEKTVNVFLESACFEATGIRKSSFRHGLRTDAATRFEKGVDIGQTVEVLKRAAALLCEVAGGRIASEVTDVYPLPAKPVEVEVSPAYIRRLSGKDYGQATIKGILEALGFTMLGESEDRLRVRVPSHKTDISIPADIAEEVMRIDGFDNIEIPPVMRFTPTLDTAHRTESLRERTALALCGRGFSEMLNNSITDSRHYAAEELQTAVRMMNSLSSELDLMRPSMLETGLQSIARNLNQRNLSLRLFEFGKTYSKTDQGSYTERDRLALFLTGERDGASWIRKPEESGFFQLKGILEGVFAMAGLQGVSFTEAGHRRLHHGLLARLGEEVIAELGEVSTDTLGRFDIRQPVFHASVDWDLLTARASQASPSFRELPRFPTVTRDLSIVVDSGLSYAAVDDCLGRLDIPRMTSHRLFDLFESEKLGRGLKSMALSFHFRDEAKTLTDEEVDAMMNRIIATFDDELKATVRR